ncbi:MAG: hypothetical protein RLZZ415_522, partial [Pseudomonadota bacterium]
DLTDQLFVFCNCEETALWPALEKEQ